MKLFAMLFFAVAMFSSVNAQKKIIVNNGDTVIVGNPTVQTITPPTVIKETPVQKKVQPIKKKPVVNPVKNQPPIITQPVNWGYPVQNEPKKDQFSVAMIILLSLCGLFGLGGLILGIIAVSRPIRYAGAPMNHITVHGGTGYGGDATANPDLSRDYHGDHSSRQENFFTFPEKKEEKVPGNGTAKETVKETTANSN